MNKYLEKLGSLQNYKRMAREAGVTAVRNPMTTAFGVGGGVDGALSTTPEAKEGNARLALRAVRNTIVGAAKGGAAGKTLELAYQHLKSKAGVPVAGLSKNASVFKALRTAWKETPPSSKLSLTVGTSGVGLSAANFANNLRMKEDRITREKQIEMDMKALAALRGIHRELKKQASENKDSQDIKRVAGAGLTLKGLNIASNQYHRGNLTGRETLYHGSSAENIKKIKKEGLKPNVPGTNISRLAGLSDKNKNLVFAEKRRLHANSYGLQQEEISTGRAKSILDLGPKRSEITNKSLVNTLTRSNKYVAQLNLPTWREEYKPRANPEVKNILRAAKSPLAGLMNPVVKTKQYKSAVINTYQKNVHVNRGAAGIGTEYIKGSTSYKKNSAKEIGEFISHNKSRFAKGVGKTIGGLGLASAGSYLIAHSGNTKKNT